LFCLRLTTLARFRSSAPQLPPSFFASRRPRFPPFILALLDPPLEDTILRRAPVKIMQEKPLWLLEKGEDSARNFAGAPATRKKPTGGTIELILRISILCQ